MTSPLTQASFPLVGVGNDFNFTSSTSERTTTDSFIWSVIINSALALILFLTFSCLRRRFKFVYQPKEEPSQIVDHPAPPIQDGLFSWAWSSLTVSDEQFIKSGDLDALLYSRFLGMCFKIFLWASVAGILVVLPVNVSGENHVEGFESLSMSNIAQQSTRMWVHLLFAYLYTCIVLFYIYQMYCEYVKLRHAYLRKQQLDNHLMSVMVRNLPRNSIDEDLGKYFARLYPTTFKCASVAKDLTDLDQLILQREEVIAQLERAYHELDRTQQRPQYSPTWGQWFCCSTVDSIDFFSDQLEQLNHRIADEQKLHHAPQGVGFVTFVSARSVAVASQVEHCGEARHYHSTWAPEPKDIYWPNLGFSDLSTSVRSIIATVLVGFLLLFWTIPVAFVSSIANLDTLSEKVPWLEGFLQWSPNLRGILQGFLAGVGLVIFMALLPLILSFLARWAGIEAESWIQKWVLKKFFLFEVLIFFLAFALASSTFGVIAHFDRISGIPEELGKALPRNATYFITYIILRTFTGFPLVLLRLGPLILGSLYKACSRTKRDIANAEAPTPIDYGTEYPEHLLVFVFASAYFAIAPIILPFACLYFGVGYMVYRFMMLYIYVKNFESGGHFWPIVCTRLVVAVIVGQLTLLGVFSVKLAPAQASLLFPLPIITYLLYSYYREHLEKYSDILPLEETVQIDHVKGIFASDESKLSSSSSTSSSSSSSSSLSSSLSTDALSSSLLSSSASSSSSSSLSCFSVATSGNSSTHTHKMSSTGIDIEATSGGYQSMFSAQEDTNDLDLLNIRHRRNLECGQVSDAYVQASLLAKAHVDVAPPAPKQQSKKRHEGPMSVSKGTDLLESVESTPGMSSSSSSSSSNSSSDAGTLDSHDVISNPASLSAESPLLPKDEYQHHHASFIPFEQTNSPSPS